MASRPKDSAVKGKSPLNTRSTDPAQKTKSPHSPAVDHKKLGRGKSPHPPAVDNQKQGRGKSPHPPALDNQKQGRGKSPHPPSTLSGSNSSNVPNYIRSTSGTRLDTLKNSPSTPKKPTTPINNDTIAQKANINRRRSLDNKPPSTAQLLKSPNSPNSAERNTKPSSTVKAKPATVLKPVQEKMAKVASKDVGKSHSLQSRSVKTIKKNVTSTSSSVNASNSTTKKQNSTSSTSSTTKDPTSNIVHHSAKKEDSPKYEPPQEDHQELPTDEPEEEEEEDETLLVENKEEVDIQTNEPDQLVEIEESEEVKIPNSSMVYEAQKTTHVSEEPNVAPFIQKEDTETEEMHMGGLEIKDKEIKEEEEDKIKDEHADKNNLQQKKKFENEPISDIDDKKLQETKEGLKENGLEEKEEADNEENKGSKTEQDYQEVQTAEEVNPEVKEVHSEVEEVKQEVKEEESDMNEVKHEAEVKPVSKEEKREHEEIKNPEEVREVNPGEMQKMLVAKPQGNKKDKNAYNDVIEETASKLREQRRNKVRALVGAFETVISLEEPESETPRGN